MTGRYIAAALLLAMSCIPGPAAAYTVSPLRMALEPSGASSAERLRIVNDGSDPITLSISVSMATIAEDGTVTQTPADDQFLIFPPQTIVAAQKTQMIQIRYVGEPRLDTSRLYLIRTSQVPVDFAGGGNVGLKVGIDFVTATEVVPSGAAATLSVASFDPADGGYQVRISNAGNRHGQLANYELLVSGSAGNKTVALKEIEMGETSRIDPGGARRFTIPASLLQDVGTVAEMRLQPHTAQG